MENKENIFKRIINFIKNLFEKKGPKQLVEKTEELKMQETKSNFLNEVSIYKEENPELLKLQNQYENEEINLASLSDEQIHELNLLYKRQIAELNKKLNDRKTELNILQIKINNYSTNI